MTGTSTSRVKIGALLMALTVVLSAGTAVAFASAGPGAQASTVPLQDDDTTTEEDETTTEEETTTTEEDDGGDDETTTEDDETDGDDATNGDGDAANASVTFENQTSNGTVVNVSSVTLPEDGYVAIHNDSLLEGQVTESVVGVSAYLEAGTHEDVNVTLFNVSGADSDEGATLEENQSLIAMPHVEDSGNETYDFVASNGTDDGPFVVDGVAVTERAFVTVEQQNATTTTTDGAGDRDTQAPENETQTPDNETQTPGNETQTEA